MTLVDIDLRQVGPQGIVEAVKNVDIAFEGPSVDPTGEFVLMPSQFTIPYNPRNESAHDYRMTLDLMPGRWRVSGIEVEVPHPDPDDPSAPVRFTDLITDTPTMHTPDTPTMNTPTH